MLAYFGKADDLFGNGVILHGEPIIIPLAEGYIAVYDVREKEVLK